MEYLYEISVDNTTLEQINTAPTPSDTDSLTLQFTFAAEVWGSISTKSVVLYRRGLKYHLVLDESNKVIVPKEINQFPGFGVSVRGDVDDMTTEILTIEVVNTYTVDGAMSEYNDSDFLATLLNTKFDRVEYAEDTMQFYANNILVGQVNLDLSSLPSGAISSPLYLTIDDSTIVPLYKQLSYIPGDEENQLNIVLSQTETLIRTYLFDKVLDTTVIDAGEWAVTCTTKVNNTVGETRYKAEVFVRHADGSETILFDVESDDVDHTELTRFSKFSVQPAYEVLTTDRLGINFYASKSTPAQVTLTNMVGGSRGAYIKTPLNHRHNQLRDLNGDPQYQHVPQSWIDQVNAACGIT